MAKREKRPVYNEPLRARHGDVVPERLPISPKQLDVTVRARLELERNLRLCGLSKATPSTVPAARVRGIVLAMLDEIDSPLSASLRARAAALAGPLGIKKAATTLRRMALDEADDLATRLAAVQSYTHLAGAGAVSVLPKILTSKTWQVRAAAYTAAMNSASPALRAAGAKRFKVERNTMVRAHVARFVSSVREESATAKDGE
jgi:HEAT repeat protein